MEKKKARFNFDFIGYRKVAGIASGILVTICIALLWAPGPNYGIDFAGGTNIIVRFGDTVDSGDLEAAMQELGYEDAVAQRFGPESANEFLIQTRAVTAVSAETQESVTNALLAEFGAETNVEFDESSGDRVYVQLPPEAYFEAAGSGEAVELPDENTQADTFAERADEMAGRLAEVVSEAGLGDSSASRFGNPTDRRFVLNIQALQGAVYDGLAAAFGDAFTCPEEGEEGAEDCDNGIARVETVGPRVGEQLRNDGINAVLLALIGILIYIAIRFDFRYAPGAVVALGHDVLITLGIFVILQEEISLPIVAALLTIVGYSLNDTIVNFDRIRENLQLVGGSTTKLAELVNRSLNECLSRTMLTSVTTLLAVVSIFFLGGGLIKSFAMAMIIGVIVGTYSSIFVASPIMILTTRWVESRQGAKKAAESKVKV